MMPEHHRICLAFKFVSMPRALLLNNRMKTPAFKMKDKEEAFQFNLKIKKTIFS